MVLMSLLLVFNKAFNIFRVKINFPCILSHTIGNEPSLSLARIILRTESATLVIIILKILQ